MGLGHGEEKRVGVMSGWRIVRVGGWYQVQYTLGDPEFTNTLWSTRAICLTLWGAKRVVARTANPEVVWHCRDPLYGGRDR